MAHERRQNFYRVGPDDELVMFRPEPLGDSSSMLDLAEVLFFKSDGERLDAALGKPAHQSHDRARIYPARKKCPERNLRHQPHPDRIREQLDCASRGFLFAYIDLACEIKRPVPLYLHLSGFP